MKNCEQTPKQGCRTLQIIEGKATDIYINVCPEINNCKKFKRYMRNT